MAQLKAGTTIGGVDALTTSTHDNTGDPHDQYKLKTELTTEFYNKTEVDAALAANSVADTAASAASAAAAAASASAASTTETNAATSASQAATSATNANTSASNAATSEANAATSETNASTSAASAAADVTYASEWANKAEDSLISAAAGGDSIDDYSALHWANKAAASNIRRKNFLINGNFDIWQRGTGPFTTSGEYSADRWKTSVITSTYSLSKSSFTLGQTDVPGNPTNYLTIDTTSSATASEYCITEQRIEDVSSVSGDDYTLSFWAKANSSLDLSIEAVQNFGTGGSPSSEVYTLGQKVSLTTSWQKFEITINIPSISGKVLGTDNNSFVKILFWLSAGTDFTSRTDSLTTQTGIFDIAQVQLEAGGSATEFEQRHISEELLMCQRYFEKSYNLDVAPGTPSTLAGSLRESATRCSNSVVDVGVTYATVKRTSPTVTIYSTDTGTAGEVSNLTDKAVSGILYAGTRGFAGVTIVSGSNTKNAIFHYAADAEL